MFEQEKEKINKKKIESNIQEFKLLLIKKGVLNAKEKNNNRK